MIREIYFPVRSFLGSQICQGCLTVEICGVWKDEVEMKLLV